MQVTKENLQELEFRNYSRKFLLMRIRQKWQKKSFISNFKKIDEAEITLKKKKKKKKKKTAEYLTSYESSNAIPFSEYEDIEAELKVMHIENFRLENAAFIKIKTSPNKSEIAEILSPSQFAETFLFCWKK